MRDGLACLLSMPCYRLTAFDLSRQRELNVDLKTIQQIEFVGQLKNSEDAIVAKKYMFVLTILDKFVETRLKFSQGSVIALYKMVNYEEARVKLPNCQLNKLKSTVKK